MIEAVAGVLLHGEPEGRIERAHRACEHRAIGVLVVVAGVEFRAAAEGVGRLGTFHIDEPGEGVGAVQGALRAAQHLDVIDIEQRRGGP